MQEDSVTDSTNFEGEYYYINFTGKNIYLIFFNTQTKRHLTLNHSKLRAKKKYRKQQYRRKFITLSTKLLKLRPKKKKNSQQSRREFITLFKKLLKLKTKKK